MYIEKYPVEKGFDALKHGPFVELLPTYLSSVFDFSFYAEFLEEMSNLDWLSLVKGRREFFMATTPGIEYSYGKKEYANIYKAEPLTPLVRTVLSQTNSRLGTEFDLVFLNKYESGTDHIGWHSDDSPEMDSNHSIAVLSLGQERRIQTVEKIHSQNKEAVREYLLKPGSLFIMPKGFQETHFHRIPKEGFQCGTRISLTFRKYKK
jgi:alkylated DNA repair dioxygenase AlkB